MSLLIPSFDNPYSVNPAEGAYGYISFIAIDFVNGNGSVVVRVHTDPESAAAGRPPIAERRFDLGMEGFPTLTELMTAIAEPFGQVRQYLYERIKESPDFTGSIDVA